MSGLEREMMKHDWQLLETRQWPDGNGHVATEKCKACGLVAKTSYGYYSKARPAQGAYNGTQEAAARPCPKGD